MVRLLVAAIGVAGAHVASAWDPSLLSNCKTCTADTQPFCMDLLEAANADSSTYDSEFEDDVTCDELEFAFECVVLENSVYPDGYLDYYFSISGNTVSDCETYADYYDTKQCNTYCVSSGGDVQEGAMEFFCEQCNEDTVADCYYYLGYSNQDATMSCDSKQLALDCVMRNFTAYPDGYIAWMASQRNDVSCEVSSRVVVDACALRRPRIRSPGRVVWLRAGNRGILLDGRLRTALHRLPGNVRTTARHCAALHRIAPHCVSLMSSAATAVPRLNVVVALVEICQVLVQHVRRVDSH